MSDLTFIERRKLEKLFEMGGGYVLDFSNTTFADFVAESAGRNIYDELYAASGSSKANRLRAFWEREPNWLVAKLIRDLVALIRATTPRRLDDADTALLVEECERIATRLAQSGPVDAIEAISAEPGERAFELLARAVRDAIEKNEPEAGLDRLHTYLTKFVRQVASQRGVRVDREKPLHSVFGEYVKALRSVGLIETDMTERILKSSISTMEAFNTVRNESSLAHDNPPLKYDESLLIFNHVCSAIRFIRAVEDRASSKLGGNDEVAEADEDIPW